MSPAHGLARAARLYRGLSQHEMGARIYRLQGGVSNIERRDYPNIRTLEEYGEAVGLVLVMCFRDPQTGGLIHGTDAARPGVHEGIPGEVRPERGGGSLRGDDR